MSSSSQGIPRIFDRALIADRLARLPAEVDDYITPLVIEDLQDRLTPVVRKFEKALIMGPDAARLPKSLPGTEGTINFTRLSTLLPFEGKVLDAEALDLPEKDYDLIVSLLDLQCINDVPGFLSRIHRHLAPDGMMIVAGIGGNSLKELRQAWLVADAEVSGGAYPRIAPFIDVRDAGSLLQRAGLALPMADIEQHMVRYGSPLTLMQELKTLGASNPLVDRPRKLTGKLHLATAANAYIAEASDPDGKVRVTLEILWLSGWAPHESQQKPLKPGSAEISLTKVLKSES